MAADGSGLNGRASGGGAGSSAAHDGGRGERRARLPAGSAVRPRRRPSPITLRILAINLVALGGLVAGLLYLGNYRDNLIESELKALQVQAQMFAVALAEGAIQADPSSERRLAGDISTQMLRRLVETTQTRARLFDTQEAMIADSRHLGRARSWVRIIDLPPPEEDSGPLRALLEFYDQLTWRLMSGEDLPRHEETAETSIEAFPEAAAALKGESRGAGVLRAIGRDGLLLSVSVPVQRYKRILGSLLLTKPGDDIRNALLEVRVDILKVFVIVMGVSVLLSLYLARSIAAPLRRLADAADRIRRDHGRQAAILDFKDRNDEIGDLSLALREMTEGLWRRMDAIERFAADVAHEIKNPLTSLRSAVETAAKIDDPGRRAKLMAIIQDDVGRLDRLITDISDASRLDAELSRAQRAPVDVGDMLSTLADVYETTGGERGPKMSLEMVRGGSLAVSGMEGRLVQVFRNLITNAQTFSPPGGRIRLTVRNDRGVVEIAIDDEGPGIPEGKEAAIFDRFYTERPEGEKFGAHSGLGLAISLQIVEAHSGEIRATNRQGADGEILGARFVVRLPAV